jgi:recombination DNA repair RAD52 pathway protein
VRALSDIQVRQLKAKLEAKHVKTRKANGADLHYVEGWHVIAEANRIFGYDAWDRRTLATRCVWDGAAGAYHEAAYTAKVRVSVRAGDITIVREGSGSGEAKAATPGQAHELALKGAETQATKRALATFGNADPQFEQHPPEQQLADEKDHRGNDHIDNGQGQEKPARQ